MEKIRVWSPERGYRSLKEGIEFSQYKEKFPSAVRIVKKAPGIKTLERYTMEGIARATDGCRIEPDGVCQHGHPSWLLCLNFI